MKVLCVCALGQHRSKLAANYLADKGFDTRYRGSQTNSSNPITKEDIAWADILVFARARHKTLVEDRFGEFNKQSFVLDVTDDPAKIPEIWRRVLLEKPDTFYQEYTRPLVEEKLKKIFSLLKSK